MVWRYPSKKIVVECLRVYYCMRDFGQSSEDHKADRNLPVKTRL